MLGPRTLLTALAVLLAVPSLPGCASACDKVRESRREFAAPAAGSKRSAARPDVALIVPFSTLDAVVGPEVKKLGSGRIPLPAILGKSLGTLTLKVESVKTRAAPAGKVGFAIRVALFDGKSRLLAARIDANVPARFDTKRRVLRASLADADVRKLEPQLDRASLKGLTSWVQRQLPEAIRAMTPTQVVAAAVEGLAQQLLPQLGSELKKDLPNLFSDVADIEIDLSELPLRSLKVSSTKTDLVAAGRSTVGRQAELASLKRNPALPRKLPQLRLSGGTVAGLANQAMADGEIPERYNLDGAADPRGPLLARADWEVGPRPMKVHLWREDGDCIHAVIGGTPKVSVQGNDLVLSTSDAKLQKVQGSARVKAGVFFSGLGRRTFDLVEKVAATAELQIGDRPLKARVRAASVTEDEVAVAVALR